MKLWCGLASFLLVCDLLHAEVPQCFKPGSLSQFVMQFNEKACIPLEIGKPVVINRTQDLKTIYRLTKKNSDKYLAEINPVFIETQYASTGFIMNLMRKSPQIQAIDRSSALHQKYVKKMTECLNMYAPYLKGPNQEKLSIKISSDKKIPPAYIGIDENEDARTNYLKYSSKIINDCPVFLHETLHLLGLVDEYPEKSHGYIVDPQTGNLIFVKKHAKIPSFDCRALAPSYSVMSNQDAAVDLVLHPEKHKDLPKRDSLLFPAHFRMITNPNCYSENKNYIECSKFAYKTSLNEPNKQCSKEAKKCQSNTDWLK